MADPNAWRISSSTHAVNVYDPSGRRVLSIRDIGGQLTMTTHAMANVPLEVVRRAIKEARG